MQYWLWVTRPEFYQDENGSDREDLDPSLVSDSDGWWTCHQNTREGDLIFLWRTAPKSDIGYLITAKTDSFPITDDPITKEQSWTYGCEYRVLHKFQNPLTIKDLRNDPYLADWGALRGSFRGTAFAISSEQWQHLNQLASAKDAAYGVYWSALKDKLPVILRDIRYERELETKLEANLSLLNNCGYDLELYIDPNTGKIGRQFTCRGIGFIDLLCYDRQSGQFVVVELKRDQAKRDVVGQILSYISWVQDNIAGSTPVMGLVISAGCNAQFKAAIKATTNLSYLDFRDLTL